MTIMMTAEKVEASAKEQVSKVLELNKERSPHLVIIVATDDKGSHRYVDNKLKLAEKFGINVTKVEVPKTETTEHLYKYIEGLNENETVDGIILQLPIYDHLEKTTLINAIDIDKDVDGLSLFSTGMLEIDDLNYIPCTPFGVYMLLESYDINVNYIEGKNVVIIGRGETSGRPMATLFRNLNANVTILHSKTSPEDLEFYVKHADIVVSCVGKRNLLKADWFKEDSIVIGVGFTYDENGKQHLDFEADEVKEIGKAKYVTNRVNCTGKATVTALLFNTAIAFKDKYSV